MSLFALTHTNSVETHQQGVQHQLASNNQPAPKKDLSASPFNTDFKLNQLATNGTKGLATKELNTSKAFDNAQLAALEHTV